MNPIINRRIDLTFKAAAIVLMAVLFLRASYWAVTHGAALTYFAVALAVSILVFIFSPIKETDNAFGVAIGTFIILAMIGGFLILISNCDCQKDREPQRQVECVKNEICTGPVNLGGGE